MATDGRKRIARDWKGSVLGPVEVLAFASKNCVKSSVCTHVRFLSSGRDSMQASSVSVVFNNALSWGQILTMIARHVTDLLRPLLFIYDCSQS